MSSPMKTTGIIFVIAAASGGGKTSLIKALLERLDDIVVSISHTTRPPRPSEHDGKHYYFIEKSEYDEMLAAGYFIESAKVFGHFYATSKTELSAPLAINKDVLLDIDWQGAQQVRHLFPGKVVSIFLFPPSNEVLAERLKTRAQDSSEVVTTRMIAAKDEMSHHNEFDYLLVNDDFDSALDTLASIIIAERHVVDRQCSLNRRLLAELLA